MTRPLYSLLCFLPVGSVVFVLSFFQVCDADIFWHLKTGQVILEGGGLIRTNLFSGTHPDHSWTNPEWLFQVIVAAIHRFGGWAGIAVFKAGMLLLLAAALYATVLTRMGKPMPACFLTLIPLTAMQYRFTERPHLFSYLFFVLTILIVDRHRRGGGRTVWVLPLLFALWSNIHPELILGLFYLGAAVAGDRITGRTDRQSAGTGKNSLPIAALACIPATLLNPEGYRALTFPFHHIFLGPVLEVEEYAYSSIAKMPVFWIFLAAALPLILLTTSRRNWDEFVMVAVTGVFGAFYIRGTPYFLILAAVVLARRLAEAQWPRGVLTVRKVEGAAVVLAVSAVLWTALFQDLIPYRWGWGVNDQSFPVAAADMLRSESLPDNLFNQYNYGGYLIFRLHPKMGVFQDGRVQAYPMDFVARLHSRLSRADWPRIMEDYRVNTALVQLPLLHTLFRTRDWGVVFWDEQFCVLVRRARENVPVLERLEYRFFLPGSGLEQWKGSPQLPHVVREMERNQSARLHPLPGLANDIGVGHLWQRRHAEAEKAFRQAVGLDPGYADAWYNLGITLYDLGRTGEGGAAIDRARSLRGGTGGSRARQEARP